MGGDVASDLGTTSRPHWRGIGKVAIFAAKLAVTGACFWYVSRQIELRQIQRTVGTTTILVTHDQAEAMALSDRVVVMNHGRAEQIGPPHEAYERPATPFVANFLGRTNLVNGATVRPEKIWFATSGLAGKVRTRIFQGNHWLYQIETASGLVTVIRQNTGEAMPGEGEAVHLAWAAI